MLYQISDTVIPQERRKEINEKILYIIENNIDAGITKEDIFNGYTGEGGLHGLSFNDYNSFHDYTEAKKEVEQGQFFTPHHISKFVVDCIKPSEFDLVGDLTSGMGNFFNYLPTQSNIYGNELDIKAYKLSKYLYPEANIKNDDVRYYDPKIQLDMVLGNPPFNLKWSVNNNEYLSQMYYCIKSHELLKAGGLMVLIVPSSFLNDEFTDGGMIKEINNGFNFIAQFDLPSTSFKNVGVDNFQTKVMIFQKQSEHLEQKPYNTTKVKSLDIGEGFSNYIHDTYVRPVKEQKESVKAKLFFESLHANKEDEAFSHKVKKLLFDIKRTKRIKKHYSKCEAYVNKYYTQEKPEGMEYKEWQKKRITKNKVISYLKKVLKEQHKVEKPITQLVKNRYSLKLKAYNRSKKIKLAKFNGLKEISFNDMLLNQSYYFNEDTTYQKLYNKKLKKSLKQNQDFKEMHKDEVIDKWLNEYRLYNRKTQKTLALKELQKNDLNLILQKDYSLLNWQQGMGKTEAGIAWFNYINQYKTIRNTFIVSSSISIKMTWCERLENYGFNYVKIDSLKDIKNIKQGDIVLISFNMLVKYQKQLKKYIKIQSNKIALLVDESHRLSNPTAKRTRATLNVFKKATYKLLMTGTVTRNNINELYPQLELLYNNSFNMLCECEYIQKEDRRTKELKEVRNEKYLKPFPANKPSLFKQCFSPTKTSVFGIQQENQDIYNSEQLKNLIQKTMITRKFNEIASDKYKVITHRIDQNDNEQMVYGKIMNEFHQMIPNYFSSTGNSRKDAMLRIIRQLQLMIKAVSIPHMLKEYKGMEEPNKYSHIEKLIKENDEKIILGTVFKDACNYYYYKLSNAFPNRSIFLIKGDTAFKKRQQIIEEFEATSNGLLICTQQSLSESVNIPTCNIVICEALQWNCPTIEQFYFRTIRLDSKHKTNVYMVTYDNTIEQNILALLMSKEKINEYIRTLEDTEQSEIFDQYGIDLSIFNAIITKDKDEDGHVTLNWGSQKIAK